MRDLYPFYTPITAGYTRNRVYLSGPMSGIPNSNLEAFERVAAYWRAHEYSVCNPVETSVVLGPMAHADYLRFDFARILEADLVIALGGWELSPGSRAEIYMAISMGVRVVTEDDFRLTLEDVTAAISR